MKKINSEALFKTAISLGLVTIIVCAFFTLFESFYPEHYTAFIHIGDKCIYKPDHLEACFDQMEDLRYKVEFLDQYYKNMEGDSSASKDYNPESLKQEFYLKYNGFLQTLNQYVINVSDLPSDEFIQDMYSKVYEASKNVFFPPKNSDTSTELSYQELSTQCDDLLLYLEPNTFYYQLLVSKDYEAQSVVKDADISRLIEYNYYIGNVAFEILNSKFKPTFERFDKSSVSSNGAFAKYCLLQDANSSLLDISYRLKEIQSSKEYSLEISEAQHKFAKLSLKSSDFIAYNTFYSGGIEKFSNEVSELKEFVEQIL